MSLEEIINYIDAGVSIIILLYIVREMKAGHSDAVAWYRQFIEKYMEKEYRELDEE